MGAFLAPLIVGYVGETINWHYGFAIAGFGMLAGLIQFYIGQNKIIKEDISSQSKKLNPADWGLITLVHNQSPLILVILELNQIINDFFFEIILAILIVLIFFYFLTKKKTTFISKRRY